MTGPQSNRTGAQVMAQALARHGVEAMFGQSIPSQLHLAAPEFGIRQIGYRTENAGAAMADGYARIAHRAGVVTAQNGPAATLLVPGLAEALKASVPVLAIVQDLHRARTDKNAFQELDQIALFQGCTKQILRIQTAGRIDDYVDLALTTALSGRPGPVVLLCPYDVFDEPATAPSRSRRARLDHYPARPPGRRPGRRAPGGRAAGQRRAAAGHRGRRGASVGRHRRARRLAGGGGAAGRHHRHGQGRGR